MKHVNDAFIENKGDLLITLSRL